MVRSHDNKSRQDVYRFAVITDRDGKTACFVNRILQNPDEPFSMTGLQIDPAITDFSANTIVAESSGDLPQLSPRRMHIAARQYYRRDPEMQSKDMKEMLPPEFRRETLDRFAERIGYLPKAQRVKR